MAYMIFEHDGDFEDCVLLDIFPGTWQEHHNPLISIISRYYSRAYTKQVNFWDISGSIRPESNEHYKPRSWKAATT